MYNNLGFFWSSISTMQMTIHLIANSHYVGIFINTIQFQVFDLKVLLTHLSSYKVLKKVDLPVKIQASPFFLSFLSFYIVAIF